MEMKYLAQGMVFLEAPAGLPGDCGEMEYCGEGGREGEGEGEGEGDGERDREREEREREERERWLNRVKGERESPVVRLTYLALVSLAGHHTATELLISCHLAGWDTVLAHHHTRTPATESHMRIT